MNEYSIRVLLVDENVLSFSKYRSIAEDLGIYVERHTCWDNAKDALYKDFDNWSAIVLEPHSKLHSGDYNNIKQFLVHALSDISAISTKNNKIIPWYIFTDKKESNELFKNQNDTLKEISNTQVKMLTSLEQLNMRVEKLEKTNK